MSYPNEDRHERDVVGGQSRNPSQDGEKHDKSKVLNANPGGILLFPPSCVVWFFLKCLIAGELLSNLIVSANM